ncbi:UNVERIFIED_CONTAM: hypothetical protein PYX00_007241 [Menopon gallinae]|uniref:DDHD domain-containing protein n=1 Tax=Menopon gallinae TaxID=328185 RepID=A0AAW2HI92_9NEOP
MGDKLKSEIQKPVNNPLLTGAGHGFPFDSFQGSSLLVPVSQDNPSVLTDQVGEPDKFVGQDAPGTDPAARLNDPLNISVEQKPDQGTQQQPAGYVRLFNAFFGGGKPEQQESRPASQEQQTSSPRSFSPYVHVPSFQTVTPALQVPSNSSAASGDAPNANAPYRSAIEVATDVAKHPEAVLDAAPPMTPYMPSGNFQSAYHSQTATYPPMFTPQDPNQGPPRPPSNQQPFPTQSDDLSKPPLSSPNAPPLFKGDSSKTYRLSHNKRPVYAPIPGLTLSSSTSAPFLQSAEPAQQDFYSKPSISQSAQAFPPSSSRPQATAASNQSFYANPSPFGFGQPPQTSVPSASSYFTPSPSITSKSEPVNMPVQPPPAASQPSVQPPPAASQPPVQPPPAASQPPVQPPPAASQPPVQPPPVSSQPPVQPSPVSAQASMFQPPVYNRKPAQPSPASNPPSVDPSPAPVLQSPGSGQPLPYSVEPEQPEKSLFAPISKENPISTSTVFNPIAVHPTGNLPSDLRPAGDKLPSPPIVPPSLNHLAHVGRTGIGYRPPYHHWFYKKETDSKEIWYPFSMTDSVTLEQTYQSGKLDENTVIQTDGGRYDVNIVKRVKSAAYWDEPPKEVRRCSWFYKNQNESRFRPYDENTAYNIEEEYKTCVTTNSWRKKINLSNGEFLIFYNQTNMAHFESHIMLPDGWDGDFSDGSQTLPTPVKMVKRGISDDFDIDDGESPRVDHLVFVVHGIGSVCDLKFRTIEEAVDVFRSTSHKLIKAHFNRSVKRGLVNRIEILPVSWHSHLHGENTGLDKKLESITLKSIPRLRNFTNDTLLDILFYTSPVYCEKIVQQVGREIRTIFDKFKSRNPGFNGGVSLVGHSLGSLILFDMLCHQRQPAPVLEPDSLKPESQLTRRMSGFVVGNEGSREGCIEYPQLPFQPIALFALGSPIGMFITVRGIESLGKDFCLPTCQRFFNIFHPFDPVAYRIEALVNPDMANKRPILIPHHKGRKRMHLGRSTVDNPPRRQRLTVLHLQNLRRPSAEWAPI